MSRFDLLAPFAAWAGPLAEVPDAAFADELLGDGLALDPLEGVMRAPCDAEVVSVASTGHSITLQHATGAEILLHIGIDSVNLGGRGFEPLVRPGAVVDAGQPLVRFDLDVVARGATSLMTPLILLGDGLRLADKVADRQVAPGERIATVVIAATGDARDSASPEVLTARQALRVVLANGIHARPAARIAAALKPLAADLDIVARNRRANARSITALLKLDIRRDEAILVEARGREAPAAVAAVSAIVLSDCETEYHSPEAAETAPPADASVDPHRLRGIRAAPGGAMGVARGMARRDLPAPPTRGTVAEERAALETASHALRTRLSQASDHSGIAEAHMSLLDDPEFRAAVADEIAAGASAPAAWRAATRREIAALEATGNTLFAQRGADLLDVERRIVALLVGEESGRADLPENAIVIADDLLPSEFLALDHARLAGIATVKGGPTSHTALLAASRGIPMLVSCPAEILKIVDAEPLLLDPDAPVLHRRPEPELVDRIAGDLEHDRARAQAETSAAREDCFTADGARVEVFANCGSAEDAEAAVRHGAEGCGLLRTEFLFLGQQRAPSRDEQTAAYREIAEALAGRPLIVRTLDAGSDKPLAFLAMAAEPNPALGARGIRLSLRNLALLEEQFLAILQGVPAGQCRIMVPMVVDLAEFRAAQSLLRATEQRLDVTVPTPLGVMVETPAAALIAEELAREADFLSLGSNDLAQYTLAADRQNPALASAADPLHPAVLRLIHRTTEGAHAQGKGVGICGSLASDSMATALLIGLGLDELSVGPRSVPAIKARVRQLRLQECRHLADAALRESTAEGVRRLIREAEGETSL